MTRLLLNYLAGRAEAGNGHGTPLFDPVTGTELVRIDATGLDLASAFAHARNQSGPALRAMTYAQRAALLANIANVLQAHRDEYYDISLANSGTVKHDSAIDVDGGLYTLRAYARLGQGLGERKHLLDGDAVPLSKDGAFGSQHVLVPMRGVALFINAFNFPGWGLWAKAAPALLSGVPCFVKPASATAWLTQRMVEHVVQAGILPKGALNVVCGSSAGLLDQVQPFDAVCFTGSAQTAVVVRSHPSVVRGSVRVNIEADSINSALLLPGQAADSVSLLAKEVVREVTQKSGQKCTAIRRVFVPESLYHDAAAAIAAGLRSTVVGNPRSPEVQMGSLVSRAQLASVRAGLAALKQHTDVLHDGDSHPLMDVDPSVACCVAPTLLGTRDPDGAALVHDMEVFGPVATLMPYRDSAHAIDLTRRGQGSLVASVYGSDPAALCAAALDLADSHGRVHIVSPDVAATHTGHGNVMPQSVHGGPGRAGGGEELGGMRALGFYHRRSAVQSGSVVGAALGARP